MNNSNKNSPAEKCNPDLSLEETIFTEVVKALYAALPAALVATVIVALSLVFILWQVIDTTLLSFWFLMIASLSLCRFIAYKLYLKSKKIFKVIYFWDRVFYFLLVLTGLTWSCVSIWLLPDIESVYRYLPALILIGISAGAVTSLGLKMRNVVTYFMLLLIPLFISEIMADTFLSYIVAFLIVVFFTVALSNTRRFSQTLTDNIRLRYESEAQQQALIKSKDAAVASNMVKVNFISMISHELRTPLNAILGYSQLLKMSDSPALSEEQDEQNKGILDAGKHLLSLIEELLDLSEIESGELSLTIEDVSLESALVESIAILNPAALAAKLKIINNINNDYLVRADHKRLKQIFINLISNAIKYSDKHGEITISARKISDTFVRISIVDEGNGLAHDQQTKLFQAFKRLENKKEGLGLGLFITKKLVNIMDGKIGVHSETNKGSTFWFDVVLAE